MQTELPPAVADHDLETCLNSKFDLNSASSTFTSKKCEGCQQLLHAEESNSFDGGGQQTGGQG